MMNRNGFALLELIVVIAVVAALAGSGLYFTHLQNEQSAVKIGVGAVQRAQQVAQQASQHAKQEQNSLSQINGNTAASSTNRDEGCSLLPYTGSVPPRQVPYYTPSDPDFRGGMTCKFIINPNLPMFTFHFIGNSDNTFGNIQITEGTSSQIVQTIQEGDAGAYGISYDAIAPANYQAILVPVDANFDGYKDLPILNQCGATGNCSYDFYLYNPAANHFIKNSSLSGLGTFSVDGSKQEIDTTWNGSYCYWGGNTYQYHNATYTLVRQISSNCDNVSTTVTTYQLENGKMQLVNSTTTPNQ